jgi:hypothetical protein
MECGGGGGGARGVMDMLAHGLYMYSDITYIFFEYRIQLLSLDKSYFAIY